MALFNPELFGQTLFATTADESALFNPELFNPALFATTAGESGSDHIDLFNPPLFDPHLFAGPASEPGSDPLGLFDPELFDPAIFDTATDGGGGGESTPPVHIPPHVPPPEPTATGTQGDIENRIRQLIPFSWFPRPSTIVDAVIAGAANALAFIYQGVLHARRQSRRATADGVWLDLIGWDFFGARFRRNRYEPDDAWRSRILPEILRPRNTRPAIIQHVADITGRTPVMYEFTNPYDMGVLGGPYLGFGVAGKWGSIRAHTQALLDAYRPATTGIPEVPGWSVLSTAPGHALAGYGITGEWATLSDIEGEVTDADIYAAVAETQAAGATIWTRILS